MEQHPVEHRVDAFQPVTIRSATAADEERIAELLFGSPSAEIAALAGGAERAARLGKALFFSGVSRSRSEEIFVAARGPEVIGALLARTDGTFFPITLSFLLPGLMVTLPRIYPLCQIPALLGRLSFRALFEFPIPLGSFHIVELHVDAQARRRGVGSQLLAHAIRHARQRGYAYVTLTTSISNPARRLYERAGFAVTDIRTAPGYEALTGSPGFVFMQRRLR